MSIYTQKQYWKIGLLITAVLIIIASLWYTNSLVKKIADEERSKVKLWADAVKNKAKLVKFTNELFTKIKAEEFKKAELYAEASRQIVADNVDISFIIKVLQSNTTVPVIVTDEKGNFLDERGKIRGVRNIDTLHEKDTAYISKELAEMKKVNKPIEIVYYKGKTNLLYYKDSKVFGDIKLVFDSLVKSFISEVAVNSASVPVIYTDSTRKNIIASGNVDSTVLNNPAEVLAKIGEMAKQNTPIEIDFGGGSKNFIFYEESFLLTQLKYYPYVQFGVIGVFMLIAYALFSTARRNEQNQVWVGMSKETAHQLGTPLSSLMAWVEYLKDKGIDEETIKEINRDVDRLNTITERFSKIGSKPSLQSENIAEVMQHALDYIKTRSSRNVEFIFENQASDKTLARISVPLFEWVIENITKNAIDAMDGKGTIKTVISDAMQFVYIDISDTGKGIPKGKSKTVFEPGFTTKQRGWGLGLSLCKRIIESYHEGQIFVKQTETNKGTTFRIVLKK